jgi:diacylglycerol diphosphate phosphatase/phosphatidate phosphatase
LLAFIPLLCALLIAISRLDDYRHDVWDVTIGSLLGMLIAWFSYRRYYPALQASRCDVPYDKGDNAGVDGFGKFDDEEQGLSQSMLQGDGPGHGESYPLEETGSPRVL